MVFKPQIIFKNYSFILGIYILLSVIAGTQSVLLGKMQENKGKHEFLKYNNYIIFKQSYPHLLQGKDLYKAYPENYEDLYKYSPTFALAFGAFAVLPDAIGLSLWNLLNAMILFFSFIYLPKVDMKKKIIMLMVIATELMTSLQNSQANGLVAGLIIFSFGLLERKHYILASFCIISVLYIKLFGIVMAVLFLFYPKKWKLAVYSLAWFLLLFAAPLLVNSFSTLQFHYLKWFELLQSDYTASYGLSVAGWIHAWFSHDVNKFILVISGFLLLMLPFLRFRQYKNFCFRMYALASVLIWVVIFNHKAESPTFIIAMSGVAIWTLSFNPGRWKIVLLGAAVLLTSLTPTDIFPVGFRDGFLVPYAIKVVPCIVIWTLILFEMMFGKNLSSPDVHLETD